MNKIDFNLNGKSGIYQIHNIVNGKNYIGSSCNLYARLYDHMYNMNHNHGHNAHLQAAWNKYGADSFNYSILEFCDPNIRLDREQYFIDIIHPEYNLCFNVIGNLNRVVSEETRNKISSTLKAKYATKEIITYKQQHLWRRCWIYDIYSNVLIKECEYLKQATKFLGYNIFPGNNPKIHLYRKKYCILLNNIEDELERLNFISKTYKKCKSSQGKYLLAKTGDYIEYFLSIAQCIRKYKISKSSFMKHSYTKDSPLILNNNIIIYFSDIFEPISKAVHAEESYELLLGNIGEGPEKDNTEINLESKKSKSSYSVGNEPEKNIISPRVSDIPTETSG